MTVESSQPGGTRRRRPALVAAVAGTICLVASMGHAQAQRVAIVGLDTPDGPVAPAEVVRAVASAARKDGAQVMAKPFQVARARLGAGAVVVRRLEPFRRANQLAREGWRAYLAVEAGFAASRLSEARRVAARVADLPGGLALYSELSLRLGVVLFHLHRVTEAEVLFRLARRLVPSRVVTPAHYAPAVVKAYAAAARPAKTVSVIVRANVPGASISIDGAKVGRSPVTAQLGIGQHVVVARASGFAPAAQAVAVGNLETRIEVRLERDAAISAVRAGDRSLQRGVGERDAQRAVDGLSTYGDLDGVVLVASVWRRGAPAVLGQLCRGVPARCGAVVEIGYPEGAAVAKAATAMWSTATRPGQRLRFPPTLPSDARVTRGESRPGVTRPGGDGKPGWWKSPWLWAGIGAASIAVGAAILVRGDDETRPVIRVRPCDFGGCP